MLPIAVTRMSATCSRPSPSGTPCASANGAEITEPITSTHPSTATGGIIRVDRLMHSAEAAHIAAATRPPRIAITGRARPRAVLDLGSDRSRAELGGKPPRALVVRLAAARTGDHGEEVTRRPAAGRGAGRPGCGSRRRSSTTGGPNASARSSCPHAPQRRGRGRSGSPSSSIADHAMRARSNGVGFAESGVSAAPTGARRRTRGTRALASLTRSTAAAGKGPPPIEASSSSRIEARRVDELRAAGGRPRRVPRVRARPPPRARSARSPAEPRPGVRQGQRHRPNHGFSLIYPLAEMQAWKCI